MKTFKEFLQESSWAKALYHSTDQKFDPKKIRTGTHFGDLGTAVKRGEDKKYGDNAARVMAFDYKPSGGSARVGDKWEDEQPETTIAHQLYRKHLLSKKVKDFIQHRTKYPQRAMMKALRHHGISNLKYRNTIEGGGSDSTIVYDPQNLKHKKTFKEPSILYPTNNDSYWSDTEAHSRAENRKRVFGNVRRKKKPSLDEGNKLWKNVEQPLSKGKEIGTVSAERYDRTPKQNRQKHKSLGKDLDRLRREKAISGYKSALGRYQDTEKKPGDIDKEKSFVVRQGEGKKARYFAKILDALGMRYGQQSTMHIHPNKEAEYHYMGTKKVEPQGKVVYNRPLKGGSGDTSFRKKQSFTTKK